MNTAVDTSVLIAIAKGESDAEAWVQLLAAQSARGDLVICEIVAAEFFALLLDELKPPSKRWASSSVPRTFWPPKWRGVFSGATATKAALANI